VEVLEEQGEVPVAIEEDQVVMVRFCDRQNDFDAVPIRSDRETICERVIRLVIRSKETLTLRAASLNHVESSLQDLARR
jgi:hypothetical protein